MSTSRVSRAQHLAAAAALVGAMACGAPSSGVSAAGGPDDGGPVDAGGAADAGASGASCAALVSAYATAMPDALSCDPAAPTASCAATRPSSPSDPCQCPVAVNPARTATLDELLARFAALGCPRDSPVCAALCARPALRCVAGATCTGY